MGEGNVGRETLKSERSDIKAARAGKQTPGTGY